MVNVLLPSIIAFLSSSRTFLFNISSAITPIILGMIATSLFSVFPTTGSYSAQYIWPWLTPFTVLSGCLFTYCRKKYAAPRWRELPLAFRAPKYRSFERASLINLSMSPPSKHAKRASTGAKSSAVSRKLSSRARFP